MVRPKARPPSQEDLLATLDSTDDMTLVVRGHLILEALLNGLLALTIPPQLDELSRLQFAQKLDLAIAVGALPADVRGSWRLVNGLRNRFAHNLHAELTGVDAKDLLNAMPSDMRSQLQSQRELLDKLGEVGHRPANALVGTCIGWLATFTSRAVVARGGDPMKPFLGDDDSE
jgi:hypothetical protein